MGAPRPLEETLLAPVEEILASHLIGIEPDLRDEARLQILEAASSQLGGYDRDWYAEAAGRLHSEAIRTDEVATLLVNRLRSISLNPSLALSSLAQPPLSFNERRSSGVYYTDFRLAEYLTRPLKSLSSSSRPLLLDPSSGTAILLVASVLAIAGVNKKKRASLLAESVFAADQSSRALRGAALALASLTNDPSAIGPLLTHLRQGDSLKEGINLWRDVAPDGFDVCVGNPPWEKLKISRHEFLNSRGAGRHYGADYDQTASIEVLTNSRTELSSYASEVAEGYALQGRGEHDLYKLFLELAVTLTRIGGQILFLVPAGLIRSMGTENLRKFLMRSCSDLRLTILENRARFFAIDTRFKFLAVQAQLANGHRPQSLELVSARADDRSVLDQAAVRMTRAALRKARPDMSIPEVRTTEEWKLFQKLGATGSRFGATDGVWQPIIVREVDMTQDRANFRSSKTKGTLPLMEGRMIHQFRHAAKQYASGSGRRAIWDSVAPGEPCRIQPQFWFPLQKLSESLQRRVATPRVGFCDITGQTNERTMLAARIPAEVVCGNKVPTILFNRDATNEQISSCWLAIVNSIAFDWMLRRVVTTTVNFFLLLDLPFPALDPLSQSGSGLGRLADRLSACEHDFQLYSQRNGDLWLQAEMRAEIEWRVLQAYDLDLRSIELMFEDFPLLDRSQPPLMGEPRSTITRDFVLLRSAENLGEGESSKLQAWRDRVETARLMGAVPYVPSHLAAAPAESI